MPWARIALLLACCLPPGVVRAAGLDVRVLDISGRPVADAVVTVDGAAPPLRPAQTRIVDQRDETFVPYVTTLRPGDRVVFRNSDRTRHHVYSFAPNNAFEMVLRPGEQSAPLPFAAPGTIAVGCNIHDRMIAYLYISDVALIERTGADGRVHFDALPAQASTVTVWHPQLRPGLPTPQRPLAGSGAVAVFELELLPDPRDFGDRERIDY